MKEDKESKEVKHVKVVDEKEGKNTVEFYSSQSPILRSKSSIHQKPSLFALHNNTNINNSSLFNLQFEDNKGLDGVLKTPYEKVLGILERVKNSLEDLKQPNEAIQEMKWVIKHIQSNDFYNFDFNDQTVVDFEKYCEESNEIKTFFDILNENSEGNHRMYKKFVTTHFNDIKEKKKFTEDIKLLTTKLKISHNRGNSEVTFDHHNRTQNNNNHNKMNLKEKESSKMDFSFLKTGDIELENIFNQDFNIFEAEKEVGEDLIFQVLAKNILKTLNLTVAINEKNLDEFLYNASKGYKKNPYHKALHGVDVMHTTAMFIVHTNLTELIYLNTLDILSIVISALLHDIGHPGLNNNFQINSQSELALIYNDKSVLENYHISEASKLLRKAKCNILSDLTNDDLKIFRKRLIESILYTDMVFHPKCQALMKNKVTEYKKTGEIVDLKADNYFDQQQEIISFLVHTADISHSSKKFELSYKWSMMLMEEFWNQGDVEKLKGLPISFLCDRTTADVPKGQMGFIRGLIMPLFEVLTDFLPELSYLKINIEDNVVHWNDLIGQDREENFLEKINSLKEKLKLDKNDIFDKINEVESQNAGNIFDFSVNRSHKPDADMDFSKLDLSRIESVENAKKEEKEIEQKINVENENK